MIFQQAQAPMQVQRPMSDRWTAQQAIHQLELGRAV
jgi:hypothetical protein